MKRTALAVFASALFGATALFAHDDACCAGMAGHDTKADCSATFANLDLTVAQKTKMEKFAAECDKGGCNKETMAKMEKRARGVLTKEQFAAWKAECTRHTSGRQS
ncbi:MAG: hypothetical protein M3032_02015 [Verrucomicrobiota bacterium]|nr:hypothetical protein [Verrucomicrobiota bacterium]